LTSGHVLSLHCSFTTSKAHQQSKPAPFLPTEASAQGLLPAVGLASCAQVLASLFGGTQEGTRPAPEPSTGRSSFLRVCFDKVAQMSCFRALGLLSGMPWGGREPALCQMP